MIEINLLPNEFRPQDGTPLPQLCAILLGAILITSGGVVIFKYRQQLIPEAHQKIGKLNAQKADAEGRANFVRGLVAQIGGEHRKVDALNNLELGRIRWTRLLFEFRRAIPEGCVIRSFNVKPGSGMRILDGRQVGRSYNIELRGYATGDNENQCTTMYRLVSKNLRKYLTHAHRLPFEKPGQPQEKYAGFNDFLKLKFGNPVPGAIRFGPRLPRPVGMPPATKFPMKAMSLDFSITVPFWMPPQG